MMVQHRLAKGVASFATIVVCVLCLYAVFPTSASAESDAKRKVLLLSSYHVGFAWDDAIKQAVINVLKPEENALELYVENMDTKRISDTAYVRILYDLYRHKYQNTQFSVIIVSDNFAFDFLRKYRDELFPGVPVVFCGVNFFQEQMLAGQRLMTGVAEEFDAATTLDILLKLHPATRELFVLNDGDVTGQAWASDIQKQITGRYPHLKIHYAKPMTMEQAINWVGALPADTAVLLGAFLRDAAGQYVSAPDLAKQLAAASPAPIYGLLDLYMGYGIVGGQIIDGHHQGARAAHLAQWVLDGKSIDRIPVIRQGVTRPMFDYAQLQRFNIPESALPKGSVILNKPYSFYDEHKGKIFAVAAFAVVASVLIFLLTITLVARRQAEVQLRDSQQRLALTLDAVNEDVWEWRISTGEAIFSPHYYRLLGYEPYEFPPSYAAWKNLIHPDDIERLEQEIQRHFDGSDKYSVEIRIRKKSGDWGWILARGRVVERDDAGQPLRMMSIQADITERKQAEAALKASEERYRALIELMGEGLVVIDREAKVTYTNPQFRLMIGFSEEELLGVPLETLLNENGKATFRIQFARRQQGIFEYYEMEWLKKGGDVVETLISPKPLYDSEGRFIGSFAAILDMTDRKRAERELMTYRDHLEDLVKERTVDLERAKETAENANQAKSVFLANMSHELRTPLNAILGFSALLQRDNTITAPQHKNLDIINRSGEHLLTLINDILDMAKIEAGRMPIHLSPFGLVILAQDVIHLMRARATEKGLQLQLDLAPDLPRFINGEETKLRQVLMNLLGNAIKFTREGRVVLRLRTRAEPDGLRLLCEVEDTGPGIAPEDQARIFDPFVQLGEAAAQKGTGLGLSLTRQFVELMGGRIHITSQLGQGSRFQVELPVNAVAETGMPAQPPEGREISGLEPGQPNYRILVVEDQPENALLLGYLLEGVGFEVQVAENGQRGIELFQQWRPHFIWMDWRMPEMDGLEATRRIRALEGGDHVKIVALTASVFVDQHQEIQAAGIDETVHKPYCAKQLFDCLARQLGVRYIYKADAPAPETRGALHSAALAELPDDLQRDLMDALVRLDTVLIDRVIAHIAERDAALGNLLRQYTDTFDYALIEEALRSRL
ncbi:MAG: PAS domain S-box protein [Candidatus Competibacteraceae bacterium]